MPTASESSENTGQLSLSGMTCERSTAGLLPTPRSSPNENRTTKATPAQLAGKHGKYLAVVALTSSPRGIPASHSHSPGSDWARKMTGIYGQRLSAYWLSLDPPDSWVRTLLGISTWGSTTCYLTWKKSVTPQGRLLFRLVPSTPRIGATGSGFLHTPRAIYGEHPGMEDMSHLTGQAIERERLWPTPDTPSGGRTMPEGTTPTGMTPDGRKVTVGLENAVKLWPTPRAEFDSGRHRGQPDTLHSAVKLWATPGSADNRDRGNLGTPAIQRRQEIGKQLNLSMVVTDQKGMKLNSAWVSRMMGYPDDWLTLDGEEIR
jgi:hypothetical protein